MLIFLHKPYVKCNPTLFSSLLVGDLHSCMANKSPPARGVLGGFPTLAASICPANLVIRNNHTKDCQHGTFFIRTNMEVGLLFWCKSSHSKRRGRRSNTCKYFHDLVMDLVCPVAIMLVGRFSKGNILLPSLENVDLLEREALMDQKLELQFFLLSQDVSRESGLLES